MEEANEAKKKIYEHQCCDCLFTQHLKSERKKSVPFKISLKKPCLF